MLLQGETAGFHPWNSILLNLKAEFRIHLFLCSWKLNPWTLVSDQVFLHLQEVLGLPEASWPFCCLSLSWHQCVQGPVALGELRGGWFGVQLELGCAMVGFIPGKYGWEQVGAFGCVTLLKCATAQWQQLIDDQVSQNLIWKFSKGQLNKRSEKFSFWSGLGLESSTSCCHRPCHIDFPA